MFISWRHRRNRLEANLVEGFRDSKGKVRSKYIAYLGSFPVVDERAAFLARASAKLDAIDHRLSAEQRIMLDAAIARKMRQPIEQHGRRTPMVEMPGRSIVANGMVR
jgi:hypothetical protein